MFWFLFIVLSACFHHPQTQVRPARPRLAAFSLVADCQPGAQAFEAIVFDDRGQFEAVVPGLCQDATEPRTEIRSYQVPTDEWGGALVFVNLKPEGQAMAMAYGRLLILEVGEWTVRVTSTADGIIIPIDPSCTK